MITVVLVDDHDLVRMGIRRLLEDVDGLSIVGEAKSGEDALTLCRELKPRVVLMDVKMPGIGGLEATRRMHASFPETRVIALTACGEDPFPARLLKAGAAGYLTKGAEIDEMVSAIKAVARGERFLSTSIAQRLALQSYSGEDNSNPLDSLSAREMQITMMIVNCHRVQAISDKLCLSPKTVNTYRYRIFEKLGVSSDVELTHLALRHGLIESDDAERTS
ncbi:MAG: UvrY/SirA/GacA family response regulator transcription factor [Natronospirillum sp.]|uniref:UvrY/SirA/GacA family response regulator transcription factor n=1 Tax=Natronospirillum sp. TaxID=2812955 RepID=UPI0025E0CC1B|nr:UvrY/SirA/GacA family response regulator transcription factor [Natronospirillum sp.]MCH8552748.1 UvrY/SirA/GacA family response regulator transcription factor [Natronospirillum sp.]